MRSSYFMRLGITVCGTLAVWLLSVPMADAAPVSRRHTRVARPMWESRPAPHRVRARSTFDRSRQRAAFDQSRPRAVHYLSLLRKHRLVSRPMTAWLERRHTTPFHDNNDEALQNSAAAIGDQDDLLPALLEPLGVLASSQCRIPIDDVIAPRSPRGPPQVTCVA
jgi:hypothetical protein